MDIENTDEQELYPLNLLEALPYFIHSQLYHYSEKNLQLILHF